MKQRCLNPKHEAYHNYGGRGITICERWKKSFKAFLKDMGRRPTPKHTLDRHPNNDGNYEPGNCRWATRKEQCNNYRCNQVVEFNGKSQTLTQWAEELGIKAVTLHARLFRYKFPLEMAMRTRGHLRRTRDAETKLRHLEMSTFTRVRPKIKRQKRVNAAQTRRSKKEMLGQISLLPDSSK